MIKLFPLSFFLLLSLCISAQEYRGQLIHNDGVSKEVSFLNPYSKKNYEEILYLHYGIIHELHAPNFKRAEFSKEIVYSSIEINPNERVWSRLHFESDLIKLYQRYKSFYIEVENKIFDITKSQSPSTLNIPEDLKKIWKAKASNGKRIAFKSLKKILTDYHKNKKIAYQSYFNKTKSISNIEIGVTFQTNDFNIITPRNEKVKLKTSAPAIFANGRFYFPRLMKNSFISSGIGISRYSIQNDKQETLENSFNFYQSDIEFFQLFFQNALNKKIIDAAEIEIYGKFGFELYYNIGDDGTLVSEHQTFNVIHTINEDLSLSKNFGFAPIAGITVDKSILNNSFSFHMILKYNMENASSGLQNPELENKGLAISFGLSMKF